MPWVLWAPQEEEQGPCGDLDLHHHFLSSFIFYHHFYHYLLSLLENIFISALHKIHFMKGKIEDVIH